MAQQRQSELRVPPYNEMAEEYLLSIFIDFPEYRDKILTNLKTKFFYKSINQEIWKIIKKCYLKNEKQFDISLISIVLDSEQFVHVIDRCTDKLPHGESWQALINELEKLERRRDLLIFTTETIEKLHDKLIDSNEIITNIRDKINSFESRENKIQHISEIIDKHSDEKEYNSMSVSFLKTGIQKFDENIIVKRADFYLIAGRPSMGKTAFLLHLSKCFGKNNINNGIISLEMRAQYIVKRMAVSEGQYDGFEGYKDGCSKIAHLPIWIDDCSKVNLNSLYQKIDLMVKKYEIQTLLIDYLGLLTPPKSESRNIEISNISQGIKQLAKEFDIPIIVLSQLSRNLEHRVNKMPQLSDLRDSGSLEQDADIVSFCYRPFRYGIMPEVIKNNIKDEYKRKEAAANYFILSTKKQRDGALIDLQFHYNPAKNFFAPMENLKYETQENMPF